MLMPHVGMPATILLYTDALPAVVVKINPKSVVVREVEHGPETNIREGTGHPFPRFVAKGLLDKPTGTPQRFFLNKHGRYAQGSIKLVLGSSTFDRDYAV